MNIQYGEFTLCKFPRFQFSIRVIFLNGLFFYTGYFSIRVIFLNGLFFYTGYFIKQIKKQFSRVPIRYRNTQKVWENSNFSTRVETLAIRACVPTSLIYSSPKLPLVFLLDK